MRLPYFVTNDETLETELTLLILRTLPNDSITSKSPKYKIVSETDEYVRLVDGIGEIVYDLRSLTKKGKKLYFFSHLLNNRLFIKMALL